MRFGWESNTRHLSPGWCAFCNISEVNALICHCLRSCWRSRSHCYNMWVIRLETLFCIILNLSHYQHISPLPDWFSPAKKKTPTTHKRPHVATIQSPQTTVGEILSSWRHPPTVFTATKSQYHSTPKVSNTHLDVALVRPGGLGGEESWLKSTSGGCRDVFSSGSILRASRCLF